MDQLHRVAPADRKQYFLLSHLEPEPGDRTTQGVKTAVSIVTVEGSFPSSIFLLSPSISMYVCVIVDSPSLSISSLLPYFPFYSLLPSLSPFLPDLSSPHLPLSQFEITVEEEEYCILTHPVMKELMTKKWQSFVRVHFYFDLLLYVIFLLTWTLLYAYPSVQEKYQYIFPRDVWRIVVEVFSTMMSCI